MTGAAGLLRRVAGEEALAALQPVEQQVALAERALAERRGAEALQSVTVASEYLSEMDALLWRLAEVEEQLAAAEKVLPTIQQQGYRPDAAQAAISTSRERLRDTALALASAGLQAAGEPLSAAEIAARRAVRLGPQVAELREENQRRIEALQQALQQLAAQVIEEREHFAQVRRYNPTSWSDIRGNGSEAEAALAQARNLLESAIAKNTMERQDFGGAEVDLRDAEQRVAYAATLLQAIHDRLQRLQEAERLAGEEIAEAARDIEAGWAFIRSNDPDIGNVPEDLLRRAEVALQRAQEQLALSQPDWLVVLQNAQEANQLADQALAGARSEFEAMEKRRNEVKRAEAAALAEAQKITSFVQIHKNDISSENEQRAQAILASIQQAVALGERAAQTEEQERAALLDQALKALTKIIQEAEQVYTALYADFQAMEQLRREASAAVETAQQSIANAAAWYNQYGGLLPQGSQGRKLLEDARRTLRSFDQRADAATLKAIRDAAVRANDLAHQAVEAIRTAVQQQPAYSSRRGDSDIGDFLTGAMVGMLLDNMFGGSQRRYEGWGSGGGGGSSFGGWGGGGGGGSSFGGWGGGSGGGSSFGDWGGGGGGGSSIGDW
ncbi:MAG: hypothetical protein KatS3mg057_1829 [Herpetosiphonaceae bacterium]|nr:MAG: hypothetical protein KatS3mg057_1829 [Herpetosiphonaceae bacterium]